MSDNQSLTQSASCTVRMMTEEEITLALEAEGKSEAEIEAALQEAALLRASHTAIFTPIQHMEEGHED